MPFKDCICFQLGKTLRQITKAYRNEINSYKLTHGQFFMVVAVMEEEGLLPSELAVKTSQDRSTTTGLLDRLEKDGWIERRPDDKDRRSLRIYLTPYGKHHRESVLKIFEETNHNFINRFTQDEWFQMQNFLNRLERQQKNI
ncbi:MarR family winged helix-turn-helix transcriptional regulator [Desulfonema magnum]|uniref:MarR-type HTH domain-containing protein n=1 Tax=Desulfonema magnum TaxID=45655 RepID=A0A975BU34_9BACT|nr:MarR family transcriptional regulator [Desulfonema magnum]QTA91269.1 MarR-type HTH domain-containing protein [Desulfonema magnum]